MGRRRPRTALERREERLDALEKLHFDHLKESYDVVGAALRPGAEGDREYSKVTVRQKFAMAVVQTHRAEVKGDKDRDAAPRSLALVQVVQRIENAAEWERLAAAVDAGQPIDVQAVEVAGPEAQEFAEVEEDDGGDDAP